MIDGVVSFVSILIFHLAVLSVVEMVPKSSAVNCEFLYFSFQFCQFVLHIFYCPSV